MFLSNGHYYIGASKQQRDSKIQNVGNKHRHGH